ncbi:MAG: hypothetical protein KDA53_02585 [Hyphomonas sp.]|nr:hypothetical protein [Hyphomonas sp.]
MTTASVLTLSLAKAFGVFYIAAGLGGFLDKGLWPRVMDDLKASPSLSFLTGAFTFALGVALILCHSVWTDPLAGVISFFGWAAAIKGLTFMAFPSGLFALSDAVLRPAVIRAWSVIVILIGIALLALGFTAAAAA